MSCNNSHVNDWIQTVAERLNPDRITWIDGSEAESKRINDRLVSEGVFTPLNSERYPNSFWCRSHPNDVARVEDRTFICTKNQRDAGPTNNWCESTEMYKRLDGLMQGCMKGREMFVVPYLMGPDGSPFSKVGFELTDSLYVVANMRIMARVGAVALKNLPPTSTAFVKGVHSIGALDPEHRYICHFPDDNTIISFNSNYGGNALQGKKCFSLRIASVQARREGWLAEHMLILGITNPEGKKHYVCAAFPSACGKTNLAMLVPPKEYRDRGWKVETIGDDIAWLNFGPDGRLYAINPEAGFFGVAPGTSTKTNPNAIETIKANTIFTNTGLDLETMTPWWEGMGPAPQMVRDWLGNVWDPESGTKASHPNARFTVPARQCPSISPQWESPQGVPVSAIIFGGRRAKTTPLVYQARSWQHGTFLGVTMASETTAAAAGAVGQLRRDPMAMLPFIGYNAGDYFKHWLDMGARAGDNAPGIFHVNWFRQDSNGKFLWPGFGENMRVLEWILARVDGNADAIESPVGYQPRPRDLNLQSLNLLPAQIHELLSVNPVEWQEELRSQAEFFKKLGESMPQQIWAEHEMLASQLSKL